MLYAMQTMLNYGGLKIADTKKMAHDQLRAEANRVMQMAKRYHPTGSSSTFLC